MTAAPAYRTRLDILFARSAQRAVILRRGPRRHFHLTLWSLDDDRFEHGQWMKGHVRLCDLSPEGDRLLYWAHQYHASARWRRGVDGLEARSAAGFEPLNQAPKRRSPKRGELRRRTPRYQREEGPLGAKEPRANGGVWTALSRPPYFTALALWPSFGHWTGGGYFASRNAIVLNESSDGLAPRLFTDRPGELRILQAGAAGLPPPSCQSALEDWGQERPEMAGEARRAGLRPVVDGLRAAGACWIEFISPRSNGDLLFGCDGAVYRLSDWRAIAPERRLAAATRLLDLTPLTFKRVPPPPDALEW